MSTPTGKFVWYEYMGDDRRAAAEFYTNVVGWSAKDADMAGFPYEIVSMGDHMVAGMMDIPADAKAMGARPSWMGYIWVEDVDAALPKLVAAGGKVFKEPADIPGVGRFAVVSDPYGGVFMLFRDHGGTRRRLRRPARQASSAGMNCTPTTAPRRSISIATSSAGRRSANSTWARSASIACSKPNTANRAGS